MPVLNPLNDSELERILEENFTFKAFRPCQASAINATLEGKNSLVLLPTGMTIGAV